LALLPERHRELRRYPPERSDAVAPRLEISPQDLRPERLLEADNSPVPKPAPEPKKVENCGHCGTIRDARAKDLWERKACTR
jgi:hypothetical protein